MARIRLDGLVRRFGDVVAVDDVTLDIEHGEFLVLLGPSGCGKTTLLRMIAGLLSPSGGRILLDDTDITYEQPKRRDVAMVFQSYALYPHLSVARNLGFPLRVRGVRKEAVRRRVAEVAEQLELTPLLARRPKELSGGQRQRVAVGRALVRDPKAFLMDEPLSNLDARLRTATRTELAALHRRLGATFVYVTHDQVEAMTMATRIAVMDGGRVEQVGTPEEIYDRPATSFVASFIGSPPMNLIPGRVESAAGELRAVADGGVLPLWPGETEPRDVLIGVRPEHLRPGATGLRGSITAVENLGSEEVALCLAGGQSVAVRAPRPAGFVAGEPVTLTADAAHVHLFDRASGQRLLWRQEPVPAALAS
ncbi:ABC transporter ATP-binding protein [Spongiactinospora sp. 9N601]|uniref:ABC transporter ATP-binding protein n=1 Tax=Spongiactinospora sp. 9N601 TaxID=3375149 RepID=UPI0037994D29